MTTTPDRTLALELVRTTEAAALAASRLAGRGDKNAADQLAVDGMRYVLDTVAMDGVVVIGEGEKDEAPMLYNGERVGNGEGPQVDIAVDPLEGTTLTAKGQPNALAVIAIAPRGSMFNPGPIVYMEKMAGGRDIADLLDLDRPVTETLGLIAERRQKPISDVLVITLDRPRHAEQIEAIREAGAKVRLITDGDVAGSLMAVMSDSPVDVLWGIGGTPEGVIAAAAVKCLGGTLIGRLYPRNEEERQAALDGGYDLDQQLTQDTLVRAEQCLFSATGVTDGELLQGVRRAPRGGATTESLVMRAGSDTIRRVHARHRPEKLEEMPGYGIS
ncbi:class II fructose-bisphosphatase [Patulibacter sp. SYSU D01012]|uniref:class II fructose-bisphosphatase n=1 Tax=Patulibacter sp. SYSU D01012 TaxID=2817381 RepID=UPI001B30E22C|nr:class II fructose-bisphosphatase [Patulibacter sp. SYSU D01012]